MYRIPSVRAVVLVALAVGAVAVSATPTSGQEPGRFRLDARAGIAVPTADLRNFVDEGPVLGAGVGYRLGERVWARADWTSALMRGTHRWPLIKRGADIPNWGSDTDLHHVTAGVQVELSEPGANVEVRAHGGLGVAFLTTEETELAEGGEFTQLALDAGLELAVPVAERVRIIGRGDLYVLPTHAGGPSHLKKEVVLPFTAGMALGL